MDYFVAIENIPYHRWQVELLIESFKLRGIQDQLVIALAENTEPQYQDFYKNLNDHPRRFSHPNYGREHKCPSLNRPFAALAGLQQGMFKVPFMFLHPDMLLRKPITTAPQEDVLFHIEAEDSKVRTITESLAQELVQKKNPGAKVEWFNVSNIAIFSGKADENFFKWVLKHAKDLIKEHGTDWDVEKGALTLAAFNHLGSLNFAVSPLAISLTHNIRETPFIHYKYGAPPFFSKKNYKFDIPFRFGLTGVLNPMEAFLTFNPTVSTSYAQEVARSYLGIKE